MDMSIVEEYAEFLRIPVPTGKQLLFLIRGFERAKIEILSDMENGIVPSTLKSYDELKKYVDQPGDYGGFNTNEIVQEGVGLFPPFEKGNIVYMGDLVHYGRALTIVTAWIARWLATEPGKSIVGQGT